MQDEELGIQETVALIHTGSLKRILQRNRED